MASFKRILFAVMLAVLVAVSSAAPNNQKLSLTIPDECKGKGFCNIKPEGYDEMQALVDRLLTPTFIAQHLGERIGPDTQEGLSPESDWDNCPTRTTVEESNYAYSYPNTSDPDYIIQHKLLRQQVVKVECAYDKVDLHSSEQCFKGLELSTFNKKSRCKSSSAMRSLLVLDYKTKKLMKKSYDIPCCCTCKVENN